jgi:hypothetical protein
MSLGGPEYPSPPIPISTESVGDMKTSMETAVANGAISGDVILTLTEPQLSSFLDYKIRDQDSLPITNPQVYLRDGKLQVYGTITQGNFEITANLVFSADIDEEGELSVELSSADFGPFPVPSGLNEAITTVIQEATTGALGPVATGFRFLGVSIADGSMVITGRIK